MGPTPAGCEHRDDDAGAEGYSPSGVEGTAAAPRSQRAQLPRRRRTRCARVTRMSTVHPNVTRVVEAAKALGLDIEPRNFGHAKTAIVAANVIGVDVGQIVKSLI